MPTQPNKKPSLEDLDRATITLIFVLRDSLTDAGPSYMDFWSGRATSALQTAAAGADNAAHALTIATRKLQIDSLRTSTAAKTAEAIKTIDQDYTTWATRVDQHLIYLMQLAFLEREDHKRGKTPAPTTDTTTDEEPNF